MTGHEIQWRISDFGPEATVTCTLGPDALCRTVCTCSDAKEGEGCVEDLDQAHDRERVDHCNVCVWLNDGPALDAYVGPTAPLRDGPIEPLWSGDGFDWRYPEVTR